MQDKEASRINNQQMLLKIKMAKS